MGAILNIKIVPFFLFAMVYVHVKRKGAIAVTGFCHGGKLMQFPPRRGWVGMEKKSKGKQSTSRENCVVFSPPFSPYTVRSVNLFSLPPPPFTLLYEPLKFCLRYQKRHKYYLLKEWRIALSAFCHISVQLLLFSNLRLSLVSVRQKRSFFRTFGKMRIDIDFDLCL